MKIFDLVQVSTEQFFFFFFYIPRENCYKLRTASTRRDARNRIFFLFPQSLGAREIGEYNTYEPGIIHRIGTKCLFTSSFELSKLGTISDLRLGSREVPRVRSATFPQARNETPTNRHSDLPSTTFLRTKHSLPILITASDNLVDWIKGPPGVKECTVTIFIRYTCTYYCIIVQVYPPSDKNDTLFFDIDADKSLSYIKILLSS